MADLSEVQVKELQQAYMEMQQIDGQMKQGNRQVAVLDQQIAEIHAVARSVMEMGEVQDNAELFVPIANGIFAKAQLKQTKEFLVNVGSGVVVPKPAAAVRELLEEQAARVHAAKDELMREMSELAKHSNTIEEKMKKFIEA